MLTVFSAIYWAFVIATMPLLFAGALAVFLATVAFDRRRSVLHLYSCAWATFYVVVNPLWRLRVEGREKLPWRGPAVLVANHLSMLDILVLYALFRPFKWVAKAELFRVPIVGWNMWLNDYVPLWRGDRESIRRMMDLCRAHLARGSPMLLFPEGTRSRDGRLQAFKDGAFRLAMEAGCPVIPIAIAGTFDSLPKTGVALRAGMRAHVRVLDPISPADHPTPQALRDAARAAIAAALPDGGEGVHVARARRAARAACGGPCAAALDALDAPRWRRAGRRRIVGAVGTPYQPRGGVGGPIPGALGPAELDGRAEWIPLRRQPRDLLEALGMRLGSEVDLRRVVLAVLSPLRAALDGEALGALAAKLPQDLPRVLADAELNLNARVAPATGAGDYLVEVSRLLLHPPRRAAEYVRAVFAAAKAVLDPDAARAIADLLPLDIAAAWHAAR